MKFIGLAFSVFQLSMFWVLAIIIQVKSNLIQYFLLIGENKGPKCLGKRQFTCIM